MKTLKALIAVCLLAAVASFAAELSETDKKWSEAVEKMVAAGSATISTPDESRAKLAKEIANRLGRESKTEKTEKGYKIVVSAAKTTNEDIVKIGDK